MSSPPHEHYRDLPTTPFSPDSRLSRDPSYQIEPFVLPADHEFGARPSSSSTPSNTAYNSTGSSQPHSHVGDCSRSPDATSPSLSTIPTIPPPLVAPSRPLAAEARTNSQVYVVHHDAGRPPVTVYTADGTEVVELPPRYNESNPGTSATSTALRSGIVPPLQVQERRQAALVPPKSVRRVAN
ncbi:hypothetical protein PHLCEN_2v975 [Hermanssonia centrifuga]|uniref:Uncharacterized protein n=1 Tax=Hermanssonia centrifuga TaxID=98765 RepID=A0A2R6S4B2_9APHY|nr:hypothetical protein PHLCEN_2v975 [Hermanssonia centrifuga]